MTFFPPLNHCPPAHIGPLSLLSSPITNSRNTKKDFSGESNWDDKHKKSLLKNRCPPVLKTENHFAAKKTPDTKCCLAYSTPNTTPLLWPISNSHINKHMHKYKVLLFGFFSLFFPGVYAPQQLRSLGKKLLAGPRRLSCVLLSWVFCLPKAAFFSSSSNTMQAITTHIELPSNHWRLVN